MYFPFEELRDESRVWVYTGSRALTTAEEVSATEMLHAFCSRWAAHGHALKTSFKTERSQFIIMAVEEDFHAPSGCSIDSSVAVLRQIHTALGVDFLDRGKVPFDVNGTVTLIPLVELKNAFATGRLSPQTPCFNTLAATRLDIKNHWLIPAEKTWMTKYLAKSTLIS